ncbi:SubName: Full=Related to guanine nucleotide-binding protein alpha-4 subunit {ECO:0000313/EMBL:CCA75894.1} [Serendipita indica DSM 11827]|nr:SubName: Full=Related to guanine nucleotide-binding protein alpha-4 subunit {ECO:0000313/EMBL:CCA75894.1} [Serendipita indica DSM 11827]
MGAMLVDGSAHWANSDEGGIHSSNGHAGGTVNWTMDLTTDSRPETMSPDMEALLARSTRPQCIARTTDPSGGEPRILSQRYAKDRVEFARLKTLGVMEHRFHLDGPMSGGATRLGPFFDDVQALIFLAPISAFDQVLTEDPSVNRMEDSLLLWKSIVSNKLLKMSISCCSQQCDLLQQKLEAGTRLATYMTSYGDRPNDFESTLRNKFAAMHQANTPNQERDLYIHMTSVVDTQATKKIITNVRDILLRDSLKGTNLL